MMDNAYSIVRHLTLLVKKEEIGVAPLSSPDTDLVNVAPLGTLTSPSCFAQPPAYLLLEPAQPEPNEDAWMYPFTPKTATLDLMITFLWPVRLTAFQICPADGVKAFPSTVTLEATDFKNVVTEPPVKYVTTPGHGWTWIQLEEPLWVQKVVLHIHKPMDSRFVSLSHIQILEKRHSWFERNLEPQMQFAAMTKFCLLALTDCKSSEALLEQVSAILLHFEKKRACDPPLMDILTGPVLKKLLLGPSDPNCVQACVGIVYYLCCMGMGQLALALRWVEDFADHDHDLNNLDVNGVRCDYVRSISAALWSIAATGKGSDIDMAKTLTPELLSKLWKFSIKLETEGNSKLKVLIDYMMSSVCYCRPLLLAHLMCDMDLLKVKEGIEINSRYLTDSVSDSFDEWYNDGSIWTKLEVCSSILDLDLGCLETLGIVTQSPSSRRNLNKTPLLEYFDAAIKEFCKAQDAVGTIITPKQLIRILRFLVHIEDTSGLDFWCPLLNFLSMDLKMSSFGNEDREEMESAVIDYLKTRCSPYRPDSRKSVLWCMKEVISKEKEMSRFCRKFVVRLLLEEWIYVRVTCKNSFCSRMSCTHLPPSKDEDFHPSAGIKKRCCVFKVMLNSTAEDIECNGPLRLACSPDFRVPFDLPIRALLALDNPTPAPEVESKMVELVIFGDAEESDWDELNITPVQSALQAFAEDGGLIRLLERCDPQKVARLSPVAITAFGRFLCIYEYSGILLDIFYDDTCNFLRLLMGVTDDRNGNEILNWKTIEAMPFEALKHLLDSNESWTDQGRSLREEMMENNAMNSVFDYFDELVEANRVAVAAIPVPVESIVWAKGTGYGVGSYSSTSEQEENKEAALTCLLNIISMFINSAPGEDLLVELNAPLHQVIILLRNSTVLSVMSGYLKNDSVLDIACHVKLYRAVVQFLRSVATVKPLRSLLVDHGILSLLMKIKATLASYLEASEVQDLQLACLASDVQAATAQVENVVIEYLNGQGHHDSEVMEESFGAMEGLSRLTPSMTSECRYVANMKKLQFGRIEMIADGRVFRVPYHFEGQVRNIWNESGEGLSLRGKRLFQESIILSSSLPLSYGSSIFLRCDNNRLDVMKVLITGPAGTLYSNGCFEFDIHFPIDYPQAPPKVHFMTTGGNRIRFNPDLHEDGTVCLSNLNTWEGRPEEQWNPKMSSLLPVLVAIQAMVFTDEPMWNDPFLQPFASAEWGKQESLEYNSQVRYYTLKYAILGQIRNSSSCFREVILSHFWLKKDEILGQCEEWSENSQEMDVISRELFEKTLVDLKHEFSIMIPLEGLEEFELDQRENDMTTTATTPRNMRRTPLPRPLAVRRILELDEEEEDPLLDSPKRNLSNMSAITEE